MTANFSDLEEKLQTSAFEKGIPLTGQFELTARCNLKCTMCYVCRPASDKSIIARERTAGEWIRLMEKARDAGMFYVLLTGGEVFVRRDFKEIYEAVSQMGLNTSVYTNGTLITPEIARWLGLIPPAGMEITLYGASAETYGRVTGHPEAFEQAIRGLDLLIGEGINVKLRTTVIKDNKDDFEKLNELADKRNILLHYCFYISPRRREEVCVQSDIRLGPEEIAAYELKAGSEYSRKADERLFRSGSKVELNKIGENVDIIEKGDCPAARSEFWVTWDGRMTPCGILDEPYTNPFDDDFTKEWEILKKKFEKIPLCGECEGCDLYDFCLSCKGRLKAETGIFDSKAPYLCEWAKYKWYSFTGK